MARSRDSANVIKMGFKSSLETLSLLVDPMVGEQMFETEAQPERGRKNHAPPQKTC